MNMTRRWLFNCQEREASFFLRLAGFMGSLPRELPLAYFLYPKAKVAYGYVALYSQPNPSLGLAFLSQVPGVICKPGTA